MGGGGGDGTDARGMSARIEEGYVDGPRGRLYYRRDGEQGPWLVCLNGIGVCMSFWSRSRADGPHLPRGALRLPGQRPLGRAAGPRRRVHRHLRGRRRGGRRGLGSEISILCGHSMGGHVSFEYYRRHRDGVAALVPTLCTFGHAISTFFDTGCRWWPSRRSRRRWRSRPTACRGRCGRCCCRASRRGRRGWWASSTPRSPRTS
jgi:pimeloyl-ACP methyl ester carboxylesterase